MIPLRMHSRPVRSGELSSDGRVFTYQAKMDDEKLIECVRSHPALYSYNFANAKYLDTRYKNYLWRKIAVELSENSLTENGKILCY